MGGCAIEERGSSVDEGGGSTRESRAKVRCGGVRGALARPKD